MGIRLITLSLFVFFIFVAAGSVHAQDFKKGMDAFRAGDFSTAYSEWYPLASGGHTRAMNNLGMLYKKGLGVQKNTKRAFKLFEKAGKQGLNLGQYNTAGMYQSGKGVKKNPKKAAEWMEKAARNRYVRAQYMMGLFYERGFGHKKNEVKALEWYYVALKNSKGKLHKKIQGKIDEIEFLMTEEEIEKAKKAAKEFAPTVS